MLALAQTPLSLTSDCRSFLCCLSKAVGHKFKHFLQLIKSSRSLAKEVNQLLGHLRQVQSLFKAQSSQFWFRPGRRSSVRGSLPKLRSGQSAASLGPGRALPLHCFLPRPLSCEGLNG